MRHKILNKGDQAKQSVQSRFMGLQLNYTDALYVMGMMRG